ncbi:DUF4369 domain-containing protein [Robertkochia solimangrovi]|uniref:DUF4369 domain-containing protein n=1 Tax=Robertkochia solimangrovi TaxID=2213046 RepID=UPI00117C6818|nr:DUF4369 domain-containing protein [Robertkochia solimangrovi]TRZ41778.1 hypothetical protein DMZ48_15640 [Robertkochia solimangrovi]
MRRRFIAMLTALTLFSCAKESKNMVVNGKIEGLKKGTLYFQRVKDTTLITIDSLQINGNPEFTFSTDIEGPEIFYLYLDKNDGNQLNDRLDFFGEEGTITIKTSRDYFAPEAIVEGSATNNKLYEYRKMRSKFSNKNLELIKSKFEAEKNGDAEIADSLITELNRNQQRSFLYTVNYIFNNSDSYVTPYLVLTEAPNLTVKYLDSINNMLSEPVAKSKYGTALKKYIEKIKEGENSKDTAENAE